MDSVVWHERDLVAEALPEPRREERPARPCGRAPPNPHAAQKTSTCLTWSAISFGPRLLWSARPPAAWLGNVAGSVTAGVAALAEARQRGRRAAPASRRGRR